MWGEAIGAATGGDPRTPQSPPWALCPLGSAPSLAPGCPLGRTHPPHHSAPPPPATPPTGGWCGRRLPHSPRARRAEASARAATSASASAAYGATCHAPAAPPLPDGMPYTTLARRHPLCERNFVICTFLSSPVTCHPSNRHTARGTVVDTGQGHWGRWGAAKAQEPHSPLRSAVAAVPGMGTHPVRPWGSGARRSRPCARRTCAASCANPAETVTPHNICRRQV